MKNKHWILHDLRIVFRKTRAPKRYKAGPYDTYESAKLAKPLLKNNNDESKTHVEETTGKNSSNLGTT